MTKTKAKTRRGSIFLAPEQIDALVEIAGEEMRDMEGGIPYRQTGAYVETPGGDIAIVHDETGLNVIVSGPPRTTLRGLDVDGHVARVCATYALAARMLAVIRPVTETETESSVSWIEVVAAEA